MNWSIIDSITFENLCFEYARKEYSEFDWEPTRRSWDGNKDGEFQEELRKLNRIVKGWYEAKYTYDSSTSIPKSHMDSTLVSGILDGEVVFILFITNGRITPEFRRRAFAILSPHRISVSFVDGEVLENWLHKNPDIYNSYFHEPMFIRQSNQAVSIEDICIYEPFFSSPNFVAPLTSLTVACEYFMYLGIKTSMPCSFTVQIANECIDVINQRIYSVNTGYNSVLIRFIAKKEVQNESICISLRREKSEFELCHSYVRKVNITPLSAPQIVCFEQTRILHEMHDYLQYKSNQNTLLTLEAPAGMGKSYLIRNLFPAINADQSMYMIGCFSEKVAENACLLCKLILFLSFGSLYELDETAFLEFANRYATVPISLLLSLRNGTRNQIVALSAVKAYYEYITQHEGISTYVSSCNEFLFSRESYIILEDFHKLSGKHAQLFVSILKEYIGLKHSHTLVISGRNHSTAQMDLSDIKESPYSMSWILHSLTMDDVRETMQYHYGDRISRIVATLPIPINVLHLSLIVKEMQESNILTLSKDRLPVKIAAIYRRVTTYNVGYVMELLTNSGHITVVALIYIIETGIPADLLMAFLGESEEHAIGELICSRIIRKEGNLLKPYHDIYLSAFNLSAIRKKYTNIVSKFLEFCLSTPMNTDVVESVLTAELLSQGEITCHESEILYERCVTFYLLADYEAARVICKKLIDYQRIEEYIGFERSCYLRYLYAQCVKATRSHSLSNRELKQLEKILGPNGSSAGQLGILYDCISEIVNNDLWMLEFSELESYLSRLRELQPSKDSSKNLVNAYLNYHNRSMMYYSFKNLYDKVKAFYRSSIAESQRLHRPDYFAYAQMDYAKTIYLTAPRKALQLLLQAHSYFVSSETYRRKLDCESEIAFLRTLLGQNQIDQLYNLTQEMLSHRYIHSYFKTCIKLLYFEFIEYRDVELISGKLDVLLSKFPESIDETRLQLYIYQLRYMLTWFTPSMSMEEQAFAGYEEILQLLGEDYSIAYSHNKSLIKEGKISITWLSLSEGSHLDPNHFVIDPRIW